MTKLGPWCDTHKPLLVYIAVCVTLLLLSSLLELIGMW